MTVSRPQRICVLGAAVVAVGAAGLQAAGALGLPAWNGCCFLTLRDAALIHVQPVPP